MTVWLLFGQIKAKAREVGSDTVAGWKLCDDWAEVSQKHLGPLRPISLEILRPDNWMKLYIPILFLSGYFPNCHLLVMILPTVCLLSSPLGPQDQRMTSLIHTSQYIHSACGSMRCGKEILSASLPAGLRPSPMKVAFWGGLSWNFCWVWEPIPSPCSALAEISPPSSFLFCHHIRPCFYPGLLPFL